MLAQSNGYTTDSIPLNAKRLGQEENRKLKGSNQRIEEVQSPSTDYSDAPDTQFYETNEPNLPVKKDEEPTQSLLEENFEEEVNDTSIHRDLDEEDDEEELELSGWTEKKDKVLKTLAAKCKYDWKKIAKKFNVEEDASVSPLELKQRYKELTKVAIPLRVKFGHDEDLRIAKYFNLYGCDWTQIATHFEDRTGIMLKNRYYSHIRKKNLLNSMLEELKENGDESPVENILEKNIEENEEEDQQEEEEETVETAAENLVEEFTPEAIEIPTFPQIQIEEEPEEEFIPYFTQSSQGVSYRKIPMSHFNYLELDNCLNSVLCDKITFTRF